MTMPAATALQVVKSIYYMDPRVATPGNEDDWGETTWPSADRWQQLARNWAEQLPPDMTVAEAKQAIRDHYMHTDTMRRLISPSDFHRASTVEAIRAVLSDEGWTCEYHDPDPDCSQCRGSHLRTARAIHTALTSQGDPA